MSPQKPQKPRRASLVLIKFSALTATLCFLCIFQPTTALKAQETNLVEITSKEGLIIDLQYKTKYNITGKPLYPKNAKAYLRPLALSKVHKAVELLRPHGFGLVVLDAWRPYIAGARLWNKAVELQLTNIYCPPSYSGHSRGIAIDVTLFNLKDPNNTVKMPSDFDKPITNYPVPTNYSKNASLLKQIMNKAGFVGHANEWWHYNLPKIDNFSTIETNLKGGVPHMNF